MNEKCNPILDSYGRFVEIGLMKIKESLSLWIVSGKSVFLISTNVYALATPSDSTGRQELHFSRECN
jgi:hypothetical protein